ncbi:hypothetical protein KCU93_g8414, partial [Aureobasidium melanogenum]
MAYNLVERIKNQLAGSQVDVSQIHSQDFDWLVPHHNEFPSTTTDSFSQTMQSIEPFSIHEQLRQNPVLVDDNQLSHMLHLDLQPRTSVEFPLGHHFYMRSWTFLPEELLRVISYMKNDEHHSSETRAWKRLIEENPGIILTIRYIGTVEGPRCPYDRYHQDLHNRGSGFLVEFQRAVSAVCPHNEAAARIYSIVDAFREQGYPNPEDTERVLIQLMGFDTLLNRQLGGYLVSYDPLPADEKAFAALDIAVGNQFSALRTTPPPLLVRNIDDHFSELQSFVDANPEVCGRPILDSLVSILKQQATPCQFLGNTVAVFIGKDAPVEKFLRPAHLFDEGSQSGDFLRQSLQRMATTEAYACTPGYDQDLFPSYSELFCYVDLWPWLKHDHLEPAASRLRRYLQIVRPIVAPVFGFATTDLIMSDLDVECDTSLQRLISEVGLPRVQYYDTPALNSPHDPDSAFIAIPGFDPSRDKYGSNAQQPLRRFMDLTLKSMFRVVQATIDILRQHDTECTPLPDRLNLCKEILVHLDKKSCKASSSAFDIAFEDSRSALEHVLKSSLSRSESDDVRAILGGQESREILSGFGLAEGEPFSEQREAQLQSLWIANVPELHLIVPHYQALKDSWKQQFLALRRMQPLLLTVVAKLPVSEYKTVMFELFRPDWLEENSWLSDHDFTFECGVWVHRKREGQANQRASWFPDVFVKPFDLQARQIGLRHNRNQTCVKYQSKEGELRTLKVSVPKSATPKMPTETRALIYNASSIDVVDGAGNVYRRPRDSGSSGCTIPKNEILPNESLRMLWLAVLEAHAIDPDIHDDNHDMEETRVWGKKGISHIPARAKNQTPRQSSPPEPNDSNYLLFNFLQEYFPTGGEWHLTTKAKEPLSQSHCEAFARFLKSPTYREHPYCGVWLEAMEKSTPYTVPLSMNIPLFRNCKKIWGTFGGKKSATYKSLLIGPPGSAVNDPFDAKYGQTTVPRDELNAAKKQAKEGAEAGETSDKQKRKTTKYVIKPGHKRNAGRG